METASIPASLRAAPEPDARACRGTRAQDPRSAPHAPRNKDSGPGPGGRHNAPRADVPGEPSMPRRDGRRSPVGPGPKAMQKSRALGSKTISPTETLQNQSCRRHRSIRISGEFAADLIKGVVSEPSAGGFCISGGCRRASAIAARKPWPLTGRAPNPSGCLRHRLFIAIRVD